MKELLEKAIDLNYALTVATQDARDAKAEANKLAVSNRKYKESLDDISATLKEREESVSYVIDAVALNEDAKKSKAEADLEWNKIRSEWDKIKTRKQSDHAECAAERNKIESEREKYNRGAEENRITREKLDKKLKAIQELKV